MNKKVAITTKPKPTRPTQSADEWVNAPQGEGSEPQPAEQMKRLTIDVPISLHTQIKSKCALKNTKMADEIRLLLEKNFMGE